MVPNTFKAVFDYRWLREQVFGNKIITDACSKISFTKPRFDHEGMAGYVETEVTFEIVNIEQFMEEFAKIVYKR